MRRTDADIHYHVKSFAFNHAAQFRLRTTQLVMKSAKCTLAGTGVIILNKTIRDAELGKFAPVIRFHKKTPGISNDLGAQLAHTRQECFNSLQGAQFPMVSEFGCGSKICLCPLALALFRSEFA